MIQPEDVRHPKFPIERVLYNDDAFSIAWGAWEGRARGLAMRWNESPGEIGYPISHGKPAWFVIPQHLSLPLVTALIGQRHSRPDDILFVLHELLAITTTTAA